MLVAFGSIQIASYDHLMQVKQVMSFEHCAENMPKSVEPCEGLFTNLSVKVGILLLYSVRRKLRFAFFAYMIRKVKWP